MTGLKFLAPARLALALVLMGIGTATVATATLAQDVAPRAKQAGHGTKPVSETRPASAVTSSATPHGDTTARPAKDIVLDGSGLVQRVEIGHSALPDLEATAALADLGLTLLRQGGSTVNAEVNAVVSPLSLVSALGMVHAGTGGASAAELAVLLGSLAVGERVYLTRLPSLLDRLIRPIGAAGTPFVIANRVWVDSTVLPAVPAVYASAVAQKYKADAAVVAFGRSSDARKAINGWITKETAGRVPELMPEGSITPTTKLVVTNAIHFKSKWAKPFDSAKTVAKSFQGSPTKAVPTMVDERQVRLATIADVTVMELPFAGDEFSLIVGVPPLGQTINAFESGLKGSDVTGWRAQLKPKICRLELPKFSITPVSQPLKDTLQAKGVKTVFGPDADFEPMLGKASKGVYLDNVYQSAVIIVDEKGGEAAAATSAVAQAKSLALPAPPCVVDRPFVFMVIHQATGTPLFIGRVTDPVQH